jgi:hypothetical protein
MQGVTPHSSRENAGRTRKRSRKRTGKNWKSSLLFFPGSCGMKYFISVRGVLGGDKIPGLKESCYSLPLSGGTASGRGEPGFEPFTDSLKKVY